MADNLTAAIERLNRARQLLEEQRLRTAAAPKELAWDAHRLLLEMEAAVLGFERHLRLAEDSWVAQADRRVRRTPASPPC